MDNEIRLVDVPSYAKVKRNGSYYALKKDMPYFKDEEDVRGHFVIGEPSDIQGKMVPSWRYNKYCTEDSYERKLDEIRRKEEEEKEEEREREEIEQRMGQDYIPLEEIDEEVYCYPINGYLAERFFRESGISEILDRVMGPERAFLMKLCAAFLAREKSTFSFGRLNEYPMELHMQYEINRFLSTRFWKSITAEEKDGFYKAWIGKLKPEKVSSQTVNSCVTLYHDDSSDDYGGWFFSSRIKAGTKHDSRLQIYRDETSGKLLAIELLKYDPDAIKDYRKSNEAYTIRNSEYPELREGFLHFWLPSYEFRVEEAATQIGTSAWLAPSEYPNKGEMKEKLKELEAMEPVSGYKILRWEGKLKEANGHFTLMKDVNRRNCQLPEARDILNTVKKRLLDMSFFSASYEPMSIYFELEREEEEWDILDAGPFKVRFIPGATKIFKEDAGRFVHFTTEEELDDQQLPHNFWVEEDLTYMYSSFINQGESTDITDRYFEAMSGREFVLLLASMYRDWIYDHIGDLFGEELDVTPFLEKLSEYRCTITQDGEIIPDVDSCRESTTELLERFGTSLEDVDSYLARVIKNREYFSDSYGY